MMPLVHAWDLTMFSVDKSMRLIALSVLMMLLGGCGQQAAPDVSFTDLQGKQINLDTLQGNVVIVNFWATSCVICQAELPEMRRIYEKYHPHGLTYVAVAMQYDPPNYVLNYVQTRNLPFIVTLDVQGKLAQAFGDVQSTPTTFIIDKHGQIIKKYVGAPEFDQLAQLIATQLAR